MGKKIKGITLLGSGVTEYKYDYPNIRTLEKFRATDNDVMVTLTCDEFTSLCPVTGQPDFGIIIIDYVPDKWCVETKSLKLYLFSFRSHGSFMEKIVVNIFNDLKKLLNPKFLKVCGNFKSRGGIELKAKKEYFKSGRRQN